MPDGSKRKLWQTYPMPKAESRQADSHYMSFTDITHILSKHVQSTSCTHILHKHYSHTSSTCILDIPSHATHLCCPVTCSTQPPHILLTYFRTYSQIQPCVPVSVQKAFGDVLAASSIYLVSGFGCYHVQVFCIHRCHARQCVCAVCERVSHVEIKQQACRPGRQACDWKPLQRWQPDVLSPLQHRTISLASCCCIKDLKKVLFYSFKKGSTQRKISWEKKEPVQPAGTT